jgi:tRNA 2-selenouridine synthase
MAIKLIEATEYLYHQRKYSALLDVRSPSEYLSGHIPGAINFPLFNDEERKIVGTIYKTQGPIEAYEKGLEFTGPKMHEFVRKARTISGSSFITLHCWRGGKRSQALAWLLDQAGIEVGLIIGGYKAIRKQLIFEIEKPRKILLVSGYTGSGKTDLLILLREKGEQVLDLEKIARHKGSAFGGLGMPEQPNQEQFENEIGFTLSGFTPNQPLWLEHESRMIGRNCIPNGLFDQFISAKLLFVEVPLALRVESLVKVYAGIEKNQLEEALQKISRKMGPQHCKAAIDALHRNDFEEVAYLALRYYDQCYDYDLQKLNSKYLIKIPYSGSLNSIVEDLLRHKN